MAVYPITEPPGRLGVITAYLMIYVVWGSTYYFIGTALQGFPPFLLGGMRFCTAGLLLLLAGRARGGYFPGSPGPEVRRQRHYPPFRGYGRRHAGPAVFEQQPGGDHRIVHGHLDYRAGCSHVAQEFPEHFRFRGDSGRIPGSGPLFAEQLGREEGGARARTVSCCWFSAAFPGLWGRCTPSTVPARRRRSTMWAGRRGRCSRRG